jgi:hypothetical protein
VVSASISRQTYKQTADLLQVATPGLVAAPLIPLAEMLAILGVLAEAAMLVRAEVTAVRPAACKCSPTVLQCGR